jgi:antitoxin component of MazEF toxin-antitoxin module
MIQKIVKTGNSLAITIPSKFAKLVGLKAGDRVRSEVMTETNTITFTFLDTRQLSLTDTFMEKKSSEK